MLSDKNRKEAVIAIVLAVILLLMFFMPHARAKNKSAAAAPVPTAESQMLEDARFIAAVRSTRQILEEQKGRWNQNWERDPFQAEKTASTTGIENLTLKGIFWDDQNPRAVVNDKTLRVGEAVDGYKVMEIHPASIVLWTGEKNLELKLFRSPEDPVHPQS